jgi:hypothetical protein
VVPADGDVEVWHKDVRFFKVGGGGVGHARNARPGCPSRASRVPKPLNRCTYAVDPVYPGYPSAPTRVPKPFNRCIPKRRTWRTRVPKPFTRCIPKRRTWRTRVPKPRTQCARAPEPHAWGT